MNNLPPPVIEVIIAPKTQTDRTALAAALIEMAAKDPLLRTTFDDSSDQTVLMGMSEEHLDSAIETLRQVHEVNISIGASQIAYREYLSRSCTVDYTYSKRAGARSGYARVKIALAPLPPGKAANSRSPLT
jgi:elongation factor G